MHKIIYMFKGKKIKNEYMKWLIRYTKPYFPQIFLLLILDVSASFINIGMAVLTKNIIDIATSGRHMKNNVLFYLAAVLVSISIGAITSMFSTVVNEKYSFGIRKQLYEKIIRSHWMDITKYHTGDLVTRLTSDAGNVADGMVTTIPTIIRLCFELIVTFFVLFYYEPRLAIFALSLAPFVGSISFFLGRKLKALQIKVQESESDYRSFIQESLSNLLVVKSFSNEAYATEQLVNLRDKRFFWVFKKSKVLIVSTSAMSLSFNLGYIGAFTFGAIQLSRKVITYGTMSIFITLVNRIQGPVLSLAQYVPKVVSIIASAQRIIELQDIKMEEKNDIHIAVDQVGVNITDLTFGYNEETVLDHLSMSIKPGEFVAIVGKSGIGKTTLVRLMMSFMDQIEGNIEFHNEFGQKEKVNASVREFIAYVPQGNTLFSGTIRENIKMGNLNATEEEMIDALRTAAGYDFVSSLPKGLDTIIGERGHGLSEGQAQRISIARAIVRKAPFIIFDEATSSLDEKTELAVLKNIRNISPRPTCLLITHRRSVLAYCDREIRINNKKVVNF